MRKNTLVLTLAVENNQASYSIYDMDNKLLEQASFDKENTFDFDLFRKIIAVIPGEHVHVLDIKTPKLSAAQLKKAIKYLIEDHITDKISNLHYVVQKHQTDKISVAIVSKQYMAKLSKTINSLGFQPDILLPDYYLLPYKAQSWTISCLGKRVLIRQDQYHGLVVDSINILSILEKMVNGSVDRPKNIYIYQIAKGFDRESLDHWAHEYNIVIHYLDIPVEYAINSLVGDHPCQLLQKEYRLKKKAVLNIWRPTSILAAIWFILFSSHQVIEYYHYKNNYQKNSHQLDLQIGYITGQKHLQYSIEGIKRYVMRLASQPTNDQFIKSYGRLVGSLRDNSQIVITSLSFNKSVYTITIKSPDMVYLENYINNIKRNGFHIVNIVDKKTADSFIKNITLKVKN